MNTLNSLAQQVSNTWYSKATIIQKNTQRFSIINVTLSGAIPHTTRISELDLKKTHLEIMHYMLNNLNMFKWTQVVTYSTTVQAGCISSQAGSKYLMSKNLCILSAFIHATLPSHKQFVQWSFDQHVMITAKGVIVPLPSLSFNSKKSIRKTRYVVLSGNFCDVTPCSLVEIHQYFNKPSISSTLQNKAAGSSTTMVNIHCLHGIIGQRIECFRK